VAWNIAARVGRCQCFWCESRSSATCRYFFERHEDKSRVQSV